MQWDTGKEKLHSNLTPRYSPSLTLSIWISLTVFLARLCVKAFCAVILVEAFRSWTDTTDMTGFQILNWMSAPTDNTPPSCVVTYSGRSTIYVSAGPITTKKKKKKKILINQPGLLWTTAMCCILMCCDFDIFLICITYNSGETFQQSCGQFAKSCIQNVYVMVS